ncbi:PilW family protein [Vibrio sagamiensis]|uniref:MSHA biogenesis protein MshO n=1 Tax=Vibrio sagamiensis NBRC 104589 TaxID=1219064 RepID=A0A511QF70_9VIBR|nr:type II secretion system protein [Vibrio sagamiensis]PNQ71229.1 type II secretion system protein [Vibrio agarivorans]GEM75949.1 MSHA biogenesis protein MshO [Vibrio sagamiensis NBRC 104589]
MIERGFTLVEMVVTIVIGGVMMLGIAGYVKIGMIGYVDSIERQRLQTQAMFVLEKMSREIRHAVPNSFYVPDEITNCLAFVAIDYSGFYSLFLNDIEFLLGNAPASLNVIPADLRMVINPSRYDDLLPSSPQSFSVAGLIKSNGVFRIPDAASRLTANSISSRIYIYRSNSDVKYCFENNNVTRNGVIVGDSVDGAVSNMYYLESTLQRGGLVHINVEFEQNGERSVFQQDIQVLNVP